MKNIFLALALMALTGPTSILQAKLNAKTLIIAAEDDWIPFSRKNGTGMANEIVRVAFKSMGFNVDFKVYPYPRVLSYLDKGVYLAGLNVPLDKEARSRYILGQEKLFEAASYYYHNQNNPLKVKNREQLRKGESVGVVRNYGYGDHYLNLAASGRITPILNVSETANIKMLSLGRVDSILLYEQSAKELLDTQNQSVVKKAFKNESIAIFLAFSKKHPESKVFVKIFDQGMRKIKKSGELQKILKSY